jgi:propanediol dehydratase small subunit
MQNAIKLENISNLIEREKDIILQIYRDQYDHKEVSPEELLKAAKQLNTNKAADYFSSMNSSQSRGAEFSVKPRCKGF